MPPEPATVSVTRDYYQRQIANGISEAELQEGIIETALLLGWQVRHARDSRSQALVGLPDLLLWNVKLQSLIWVELKVEKGKLTIDHLTRRGVFVQGQQETIEALRACGQVVYIWRPSDWQAGTVERVLKGEGAQ